MSKLRGYIEEACESIDASVFSGDVLASPIEREELMTYIGRWIRAIRQEEELSDIPLDVKPIEAWGLVTPDVKGHDGPDFGDGHDWEGFPGGCERFNCAPGCDKRG
jgi:hypothetical protein